MESKNRLETEKSKKTSDEDSSGENYEQAQCAKRRAKLNVTCDLYSSEELIKKSPNFCGEDKASADASTGGPPMAILDEKMQSQMEKTTDSLSELDAMKENANQVVNEEDRPPQILLSSPGRAHSGRSTKKLLVLDVNGLLADIIPYARDCYRADTIIGSKAVFKRPHCDDFLQFCFERFNVGVWSSRTKRNVERVLDFLLGNTGHNVLFCWDQSHCTETGFNTIENRDKPLVLKELKKLWEKEDPNLPWDRGEYDESNTLLLDDSPYKALRNPPHTAIFPHTYHYRDRRDNQLGPGGDLRVYLEKLASADNVQKYVEQHPFGQRPITKTNLSWKFYLRVIGTTPYQPEADATNINSSAPESVQYQLEADATTIHSSAPESVLEVNDNNSSVS